MRLFLTCVLGIMVVSSLSSPVPAETISRPGKPDDRPMEVLIAWREK